MNAELTLAIEELRQRQRDRSWFIPVLLSGAEPPDLEIGGGETLRDLQWVDLSSDWSEGISKIVDAILASSAADRSEAAKPEEWGPKSRPTASNEEVLYVPQRSWIMAPQGLGPKLRLLFFCLVLLMIPLVPLTLSTQKAGPASQQLGRHEMAGDQADAPSSDDLMAQRAFSEGREHLKSYDLFGAEGLFCQAKRRDPNFLRTRLYLARTWRDIGYDDAARRESEEILNTGRSLGIAGTELRLYEAFRAEIRGDWEEAIRGYRSLWDEKGVYAFDALALVEALNLAGRSGLALETIAEARRRYAEEKVKIYALDEVRFDIARAIALSNGPSARQLAAAKEAERKAREMASPYLVARAKFVQCGALSRMEGDHEFVCQQALAEFQRQQRDSADAGKVYQALGAMADSPQDALKQYQKALAIYRRLGFYRGISDMYVNIASALSEGGRENEAAQFCGAALHLAGQIASLHLPEIQLNCVYYSKVLDKQFSEARDEAEEALALARQQGNWQLEVASLHSMAYMEHAMRNHNEALQLYKDAIAMASELGDESKEAKQTVLLYAWLLSDLGRHLDARNELSRALKPYHSVGDRREVVAEVLCFDRKHSILGLGTVEWLRMLKETADFDPEQCEAEEDGEGTAPFDLDRTLWEPINVKERNC